VIRFSFKRGLRFLERQRIWTLLRRLANQKLQLEDEAGELMTISEQELLAKWLKRDFVIDEESVAATENFFFSAPARDLSTYRDDQRRGALRRQFYLNKLGELTRPSVAAELIPKIREIALELGDTNPPSAITVYRWWRSYRNTKSASSLVDGRSRAGRRRKTSFDKYLDDALEKVYLNPQKHPISAVYDEVCRSINLANQQLSEGEKIACPSRSTVYRRISDLEKHIVDQSRLGKRAAERQYRPVLGTVNVSHILERVEVDHTPLDVIVIDADTALPLGRPWLTVAIDRFSRAIMGFYVCFHEPSSFSLLQCIKRAILPKDTWLRQFPDIKEKWPCYGIPVLIASDNGMDLHSDAYKDICYEIGVQPLFCPSKEPEYKGSVERFFRTINQGLIHRLPGSVFSNTRERGDYPSEEVAAIDLKTLTHLFTKWVVEVYHCSIHRKLGTTPLAKWTEGLAHRSIELPANPEQLDTLIGIPCQRTLFRYGLEVDNLLYNSPELQGIYKRTGSSAKLKLKLKYYEDDVSYIHVFDPQSESYVRVPAVEQSYAAGLTRHIHALIQSSVRCEHGSRFDINRLLEVKAEIQTLVNDAIKHKKMATRKRGASLSQQDSESLLRRTPLTKPSKARPSTAKRLATEPLDPGLNDDLPVFNTSLKHLQR
jgi:putative transposase